MATVFEPLQLLRVVVARHLCDPSQRINNGCSTVKALGHNVQLCDLWELTGQGAHTHQRLLRCCYVAEGYTMIVGQQSIGLVSVHMSMSGSGAINFLLPFGSEAATHGVLGDGSSHGELAEVVRPARLLPGS